MKPRITIKPKDRDQNPVPVEGQTLSKPKITLKVLPPKSGTLPPLSLRKEGTVYMFTNEVRSPKLAVFDMDDTLIHGDSGSDNWQWAYQEVPTRLRELVLQGWKLVIISNQHGLAKGQVDLGTMTRKLQSLYNQLQLPIEIYLATEKDTYRKPMTDLWTMILTRMELTDKDVDPQSFYCGDAAGRPKGYFPGRPKDFAITDRYFAYNCGLRFLTPETMFLGLTRDFPYTDPYQSKLNLDCYRSSEPYPLPQGYKASDRNLILMVGSIASGKTILSQNPMFAGYVHLNNDTIKNAKKLRERFETAIGTGQSVIIDNTNPQSETRKAYITKAKGAGYKVYVYYMDFPKELSIHLNHMRAQLHHGQYPAVPIIAIHKYYKDLEPPQSQEGFDEIMTLRKLHWPKLSPEAERYFAYHYDLAK